MDDKPKGYRHARGILRQQANAELPEVTIARSRGHEIPRRYVWLTAHNTVCPLCQGTPRLLCSAGHYAWSELPVAFYVCSCGYIGQIGVGPVERMTGGEEDE